VIDVICTESNVTYDSVMHLFPWCFGHVLTDVPQFTFHCRSIHDINWIFLMTFSQPFNDIAVIHNLTKSLRFL